jgi:HK97 family phage major capsid protein
MKLDQIKAESREVADKIDNLRAVESDDAAVIEQRDADLAGLMARAEELEAAAEKAASVAEARAKLDAIVNRCSALEAPRAVEAREVAKPRAIQYGGRIRHFHDAEQAYRCGQFIAGYVLGDASAREWCERNDVYTRAMGGSSATKGGAFVDDVLSQTLIRNVEEKNEVYNEMQRFPMTSDTLLVPKRTGGFTGAWIAENAEISTSDATASQVQLVAGKYAVGVKVANELLADSVIDLSQMVVQEFTTAYTAALTEAVVNGDGSSSYGGITGILDSVGGILASGSAGSIHTTDVGNNLPTEVTVDDFTALLAMTPRYALDNAKFICSPYVYHQVMQRLDLAQGVSSLQTGAGASFLGYEVVLSQAMPGSSAGAGDCIALFGDFSRAGAFGIRRDFEIRSSADRYVEYDQTALFGTLRATAVWHDLGSASAAGPVVGLELGAAS